MGLKVIKNNRGSAYVFVIIIMFTVFLMLSIVLSSTRYEAITSAAYMKSLGMYELAESGVYRGVQNIREMLLLNKDDISSQSEAEVFIMSQLSIVGRNDYFEFFKYSIQTLEREGVEVEYVISTTIKAEPVSVVPQFTIISLAKIKDTNMEVKVKGSISLLCDEDGIVYPQLELLRQVN